MGKQELEILEPSLWRYEWKDKHTKKESLAQEHPPWPRKFICIKCSKNIMLSEKLNNFFFLNCLEKKIHKAK